MGVGAWSLYKAGASVVARARTVVGVTEPASGRGKGPSWAPKRGCLGRGRACSQGLGLWWGSLNQLAGGGGVTLVGAARRPYEAGASVAVVLGARVVGAWALPNWRMSIASFWGATVGGRSIRAVSTSSRCGFTMSCDSDRAMSKLSGYAAAVGHRHRPMLARRRPAGAMGVTVIISMANSGVKEGLAEPEEALCAGGCDLLSRRLAIQGGREIASLSVEFTA